MRCDNLQVVCALSLQALHVNLPKRVRILTPKHLGRGGRREVSTLPCRVFSEYLCKVLNGPYIFG